MRALGAAQVLLGFCLEGDHLEVAGPFWFGFVLYTQALCKASSPFGPAFKEISMFLGVGGNQLPLQNDG